MSASASDAQRRAIHMTVHRTTRAGMNARRVDENDLLFGARQDAENAMTRGLRLGTDDADFALEQRIQQRRLAHVGPADDGGKAAAIVRSGTSCSPRLSSPRRRYHRIQGDPHASRLLIDQRSSGPRGDSLALVKCCQQQLGGGLLGATPAGTTRRNFQAQRADRAAHQENLIVRLAGDGFDCV